MFWSLMDNVVVVSAKIPKEIYEEILLRIPHGERSGFIREAIIEKLRKVPAPNKILELEKKIGRLELDLSEIKKYLVELEILTYEKGKINPHTFCMDKLDHEIVDYLLHYKGATTTEIANFIHTNRWLILSRLRKIVKSSEKQLGKPIVEYCAGERSGKKKAWWMSKKFIEL